MPKSDTIIISIPSVWAIRNFIISGLLTELEKKYRVVVSTNKPCGELLKTYGITDIIVVGKTKGGKLSQFIFTILQKAFTFRNKIYSVNNLRVKTINKSYSRYSQLINAIASALAFFVTKFYLFDAIEHFWLFIMKRKVDSTLEQQVRNLHPLFYLSTSFVLPEDRTMIYCSLKNKIKIYTHIFSFDNITSRGYLPIRFFQKYMVWNEKMKRELTSFYNIDPGVISLTGTPQFSFHLDKSLICSRDDHYRSLDIPASVDYFLYCANHSYHTPHEPELVDYLINSIEKVSKYSSYFWVLRFHPLDDYSRWDNLIKKYPDKIKVSIPWKKFDNSNFHLGYLTRDDLSIFNNVVRYSYAVLSVASTISIDAAVLNRPSFCIGFHPFFPDESHYYYSAHFSDHFKPVMEFNASPLATNVTDLTDYLEILSVSDLWMENRQALVRFLLGDTLTQSKKLIMEQLLEA